MYEEQPIDVVTQEELREKALLLKKEGYRLVQISCVEQVDNYYLDYTLDNYLKFHGLRLYVPKNALVVESLSDIYLAAFTYENEISELFGIKVNNMAIDYGGNFYRIKKKTPFNAEDVNVLTKKDT